MKKASACAAMPSSSSPLSCVVAASSPISVGGERKNLCGRGLIESMNKMENLFDGPLAVGM